VCRHGQFAGCGGRGDPGCTAAESARGGATHTANLETLQLAWLDVRWHRDRHLHGPSAPPLVTTFSSTATNEVNWVMMP
jgi:hypothetical protein